MMVTWLDLPSLSLLRGCSSEGILSRPPTTFCLRSQATEQRGSPGVPLAPWEVHPCHLVLPLGVTSPPLSLLKAFVLTTWGLLILENHFLLKGKKEKTLRFLVTFPLKWWVLSQCAFLCCLWRLVWITGPNYTRKFVVAVVILVPRFCDFLSL